MTTTCIKLRNMEEKPVLYQYTIVLRITFVTNEIKIVHYKDNESFCVVHWFDFIRDSSMLRKLVNLEGKILQHIQGCLRPSCVLSVCFIHKPTDFMTCGRSVKEKVLSFISYCILFFNHSPITCAQIFSLTNH